ncbi:MAG TPA: type II toxin-antitoxin system RelE/ParE family toxin [Pseudomonadales bacterium]|jgi:plasmid stabilization system protein ParE|nr:type II toxin-antitoxin system RelE/ParE family toxin [Pseudomonadales bacterium]HNI37452.1 type II toxin-antitoxin system RelE/ParE family toxin [Pseudomonadales bacterium]HNL91996.1 type II toxin-antitoxin system RelE/ParE family toxin [Pseudomonadales bacterium]
MKISVSASAFEDLENIISYYNEQGASDISNNFTKAIIEHIQVLSNHPDLGRVVPEFEQEHIREIIHKPFRVIYQRNTNSIEIIRVWRGERLLVLP